MDDILQNRNALQFTIVGATLFCRWGIVHCICCAVRHAKMPIDDSLNKKLRLHDVEILNSVCVANLKPRTCGEVEVECVEVWRWLVARAKRDMMRHVYRGGCDGWWKWRSLEMGQWPSPLCGVGVHQKFVRSPGRISHHKIWVGSEAGLTVFLLNGVRQLAWYHQQFFWWKCNFNGSDEAVVLHSSPFIRKLRPICILQLWRVNYMRLLTDEIHCFISIKQCLYYVLTLFTDCWWTSWNKT